MTISMVDEVNAAEDVMARAPKTKLNLNAQRVAEHVGYLKAAGADRKAFDMALTQLQNDSSLIAAELIEIANTYAVAGARATSKVAALKRIEKRFTEIVRTKGNVRIAEKARPW